MTLFPYTTLFRSLVSYRPANGSVYLGANTTLSLDVRQTTADLSMTVANESVTVGDRVVVTGDATVNGTPVPNASVRVSIGGVTLSTVETASDGSYSVAAELPANVAAGSAEVEAQIVPGDRAVRSGPVTEGVSVDRTSTTLSLNATSTAEGVRAVGTLRTVDGRPLANETVELCVDNATVATVETDSDGQFVRNLSITGERSGTVTVTAVFDQPRGNLGGTQAEQAIDFGVDIRDRGLFPVPLELLGSTGLVGVSIAVIGWLVRRRDTVPEPDESVVAVADTGTVADTGVARDLLERAGGHAASGESDDAVRALYAAVRRSMNGDPQKTHREFYADAIDGLDADAAGTLERLTEAYEQVMFSQRSVEASVADDLVDRTEQLVESVGEDATR